MEQTITVQVTDQGILIPDELLGDLDPVELEIVREKGRIVIRPKQKPEDERDQVDRALESLQHQSARVRVTALDALAANGTSAKDAIVELAAALSDEDRDVRHHAVKSVGIIGAAPDPVVVGLIEVMQDPRVQA